MPVGCSSGSISCSSSIQLKHGAWVHCGCARCVSPALPPSCMAAAHTPPCVPMGLILRNAKLPAWSHEAGSVRATERTGQQGGGWERDEEECVHTSVGV